MISFDVKTGCPSFDGFGRSESISVMIDCIPSSSYSLILEDEHEKASQMMAEASSEIPQVLRAAMAEIVALSLSKTLSAMDPRSLRVTTPEEQEIGQESKHPSCNRYNLFRTKFLRTTGSMKSGWKLRGARFFAAHNTQEVHGKKRPMEVTETK